MSFNPYLSFNGECEAAFKFYERCFGAQIVSMFKYSSSPMENQVPPEWADKVMHSTLKLGNDVIMGADPPGGYEVPRGFSISVNAKDTAEADRMFNALSTEGKIVVPIQQTFWALRFGMVVDQFGIPWMINCEQPVN